MNHSRSKPNHLFDVFFQLKRNQGQDVGEIVKFYPDTYSDDVVNYTLFNVLNDYLDFYSTVVESKEISI